MAVPVHDHTGEVMAVLSVSGPSSRVTRARVSQLLPSARSAAAELSRVLGYAQADDTS